MLALVVFQTAYYVHRVEVCRAFKEFGGARVVRVYLGGFEDLERRGPVAVPDDERSASRFALVAHHAAYPDRAVEFGPEGLGSVAAVLGFGHLYAQGLAEEVLYFVAQILAFWCGIRVIEVDVVSRDVGEVGHLLAHLGHLVEGEDVAAYGVAQLQGTSHENLLPMVCRRLHPLHADVVYVFDGHKLGFEGVEIVDERPVSCRAGEYGAVFFEERAVVHVHGYGVRGLVLICESDVVFDSVALLVRGLYLIEDFAEERLMLWGDGDREVYASVRVAHVCLALHEMLGERGTDFVRVAVEFQYSLGLAAVVQPFGCEEFVRCPDRVKRGSPEDGGVIECEFFEIVAQAAHRFVGLVHSGKNVLEHA